jgi:hypothetical protein
VSIPYYKVEYSINVWGGTYFFAFDVLFAPNVTIEKRSGKKLDKGWYTFCNTTRLRRQF